MKKWWVVPWLVLGCVLNGWAVPAEVQNLQLAGGAIFWDPVPGTTVYRVVRGTLSGLPGYCSAGYGYLTQTFLFDGNPPLGDAKARRLCVADAAQKDRSVALEK